MIKKVILSHKNIIKTDVISSLHHVNEHVIIRRLRSLNNNINVYGLVDKSKTIITIVKPRGNIVIGSDEELTSLVMRTSSRDEIDYELELIKNEILCMSNILEIDKKVCFTLIDNLYDRVSKETLEYNLLYKELKIEDSYYKHSKEISDLFNSPHFKRIESDLNKIQLEEESKYYKVKLNKVIENKFLFKKKKQWGFIALRLNLLTNTTKKEYSEQDLEDMLKKRLERVSNISIINYVQARNITDQEYGVKIIFWSPYKNIVKYIEDLTIILNHIGIKIKDEVIYILIS